MGIYSVYVIFSMQRLCSNVHVLQLLQELVEGEATGRGGGTKGFFIPELDFLIIDVHKCSGVLIR